MNNMEKKCTKCGEPKEEFTPGRNTCTDCTLEYHKNWQRENRDRVAKYYRNTTPDAYFGVIAQRYRKPPRNRGGRGKDTCSRCPSLPRCKVFVKLDAPLDCEKVSKSDIIPLSRVGWGGLEAIGWTNRTKVWTPDEWSRWHTAIEEAL